MQQRHRTGCGDHNSVNHAHFITQSLIGGHPHNCSLWRVTLPAAS